MSEKLTGDFKMFFYTEADQSRTVVPPLIQPVKLIKNKLFKLQTLCDESDSAAKRNLLG